MMFQEVITDDLKTYDMRAVDDVYLDEIQILCNACSDYYLLDKGAPAGPDEAQCILDARPNGKSREDQFNIGVFSESSKLVALIHIIKDYPKENVWMLGLMLIDPKERNNKLGTLIHKEIVKSVKDRDGQTIRIGVLDNNIRALKFWDSLGYEFEKETEISREDNRVNQIKVFNYRI